MRREQPSPAIIAWRAGHALIALAFLSAIGYVWWCAITGRRDRILKLAAGSLVAEGTVVAANHGDCPLGPVGERIGDPVPLFELVLPPRAAKRAIPVLGAVAALGVGLVAIRPRADRKPVSPHSGWSEAVHSS